VGFGKGGPGGRQSRVYMIRDAFLVFTVDKKRVADLISCWPHPTFGLCQVFDDPDENLVGLYVLVVHCRVPLVPKTREAYPLPGAAWFRNYTTPRSFRLF
jgi:hypothetical protein